MITIGERNARLAVDYALEEAGDDALQFLKLWRDNDEVALRAKFPAFLQRLDDGLDSPTREHPYRQRVAAVPVYDNVVFNTDQFVALLETDIAKATDVLRGGLIDPDRFPRHGRDGQQVPLIVVLSYCIDQDINSLVGGPDKIPAYRDLLTEIAKQEIPLAVDPNLLPSTAEQSTVRETIEDQVLLYEHFADHSELLPAGMSFCELMERIGLTRDAAQNLVIESPSYDCAATMAYIEFLDEQRRVTEARDVAEHVVGRTPQRKQRL